MSLSALILSALLSAAVPALDTLRIPCILVEFTDIKFEDEEVTGYFDSLLNAEGYSEGMATGSVRDYFRDNSLGAFTPVFDVFGPVTLTKYRAYYGRDVIEDGLRADAAADRALAEACTLLDPDVDFSVYDRDSDGVLDLVMYIYAGHDQSQGGPQDAIWAHHWSMSESTSTDLKNVVLDGLRLDSYFCSAQLRGKDGRAPAGIGVISHEFGHSLGLPDFYDQVAADGKPSRDVGGFALMCYGANNNFGFTPPYFTAEERIILGWMERESLLELQPGRQVLSAIKNNMAYVIPTLTEGECFILEYRDSKGWDTPLPEGLVVYHLDRSEAFSWRWDAWKTPGEGINDNPQHPCYYIVPSYSGNKDAGNMVFPGVSGALSLEPIDWSGNPAPCQLTNIELTPDGVSLYAQFDCGPNVNGYVRNIYGDPIEGATLVLDEGEEVLSDPDGHYYIPVEEGKTGPMNLMVSAPGYRSFVSGVSLGNSRVISVPVSLRRESEGEGVTLSKYDNQGTQGYYNKPGIGAVRFTPEDLAPYAGSVLREIVFYPYLLPSFTGQIYVTVDIGPRRVLTKLVEMPSYGVYFRNSVDVSEEGIVIPEGEYVYIGYGSPDTGTDSFFLGTVYPGDKKNSYYSPFSLTESSWKQMYVERADIMMNLMLEAKAEEQMGAQDLSYLGYTYIAPGSGAWLPGETFALELVRPDNAPKAKVSWLFNGEEVKGAEVTLESGYHVLEAVLEYESGVTERVRKEFSIR